MNTNSALISKFNSYIIYSRTSSNVSGVPKDLSKASYWTMKAYENPKASASIQELAEDNWNTFELWNY